MNLWWIMLSSVAEKHSSSVELQESPVIDRQTAPKSNRSSTLSEVILDNQPVADKPLTFSRVRTVLKSQYSKIQTQFKSTLSQIKDKVVHSSIVKRTTSLFLKNKPNITPLDTELEENEPTPIQNQVAVPVLKGQLIITKTIKSPEGEITKEKTYNAGKLLGTGKSANVYALDGEGHNKDLALKLDRSGYDKATILRGDEISQRLFADKKEVIGIVPKNKGIIYVVANGYKKVGVLIAKFTSTIDDLKGESHKEKLDVFMQITKGLRYMHQKNFHHGDLKGGNIFYKIDPVTKKNIVAIGDLDGGQFKNEIEKMDKKLEEVDYSYGYTSAEDITLRKNPGGHFKNVDEKMVFRKAIDIYSLGATFKEMLGVPLYEGEGPNPEMFEVVDVGTRKKDVVGTTQITPEVARKYDIPPEMCKLVNRMLDPDYKNRPSIKEVQDEIQKMQQAAEPQL